MEKKRILIFSDYWKQKSGYACEMRNILPHLQKAGHDIGYVALWYNGFPIETDIRTYITETKEVKSPWAAEVLHYAIDDFDPDIILYNQDYYPLRHLAFVLAHPMKAKTVAWGLCDGDGLDFDAYEPVKWVHQHVFKTNFAKKQVQEIHPQIDGPIIAPPLNKDVFHELPNKKELRKQYGLENMNVVLCVARPQLRKNIPTLLEAMTIVIKKIPNTILILAATHEPKDFDGTYNNHNVEGFINKFGLQNNVIIPKNKDNTPISDEAINTQYNLADVNVITSFGEGFFLIATEAGISKVPTIGVNHSAFPESVGDRGWLVEPAAYIYSANGVRQAVVTPEAVAEKIIYALEHKEERIAKGIKSYEFAKTLTPESRASQLLDVFNKVIEEDKKPLALQ